MTPIEALKWIFETYGEDMKPYLAFITYDPQIEEYHCFGCNGKFISVWPEWKKPTDETFPHEKDCKYMAAKKQLLDNNPIQATVKDGA